MPLIVDISHFRAALGTDTEAGRMLGQALYWREMARLTGVRGYRHFMRACSLAAREAAGL